MKGARTGGTIITGTALLVLITVIGTMTRAGGFRSPDECLAYSGDAHLNCLYAYIEIQQDKMAKMEEELKKIRASQSELESRVNRQASVTDDLQRRLADQSASRVQVRPSLQVMPFFGYGMGWGPYPYGSRFYYGSRLFGPCYGPWYPCW